MTKILYYCIFYSAGLLNVFIYFLGRLNDGTRLHREREMRDDCLAHTRASVELNGAYDYSEGIEKYP